MVETDVLWKEKQFSVRMKEDVWSVGVILYLMVTGGNGLSGKFDFKEQQWVTLD